MNKLFKIPLIALAGIIFLGVNYATTPVASAVSISTFTANGERNQATVNNGDSVLFAWQSDSPQDKCTLTGGNIPAAGIVGHKTDSYTQQVTTANTAAQGPQDITFGLKCSGLIDSDAYVHVLVNPPASATQPVVRVTATPSQMAADGSTQQIVISWQASNTKAPNGCTASGPGTFSGPMESSGSFTVKPALLGTYSLTCTSPTGETGTGSAMVSTSGLNGQGGSAAPGAGATTDLSKLRCMTWNDGINIGACAALSLYYVVYIPSSWILYGSGYIFDTALSLSIDKKFIVQPFINNVWKIVRDFSNMIFIFILIYTGIRTMLGMGEWRKTVLNVVIIALLINFSLFFTQVVIDAGNVLAVGVYSSMGTVKDRTYSTGDVKERNISGALVAGFNPQSFIGATPVAEPLDAIVIFIIAAILSLFTAYIFFKAALLFIGRLLAFWYLMVISPFAFTSITLPSKANIFDSWTDTLIDQSFVAPIFLFFIYLILQVISSGFLSGMLNSSTAGVGGFFFDKLIIPIVLCAMIILALKKTLSVAEKMAGDFGAAAAKFVGSAVGTVATVAMGGASLAAGAAGKAAMASGVLQNASVSGNAAVRGLGKLGLLAGDAAQTATFDPRNIKAVASGAKLIGADLGTATKFNYAQQTKEWRGSREKWNEKMGGLMEAPKEQMEAAKAEVANLDRLVQLAEDEANNSTEGKAVAAAKKAEKEAEDKLKESKRSEDEAIAELDKAKKLGDAARETAARFNLNKISGEVQAANSAHITAKNSTASAGVAYAATGYDAKITAQKNAQKAAVEAVKNLTKESDAQREAYAEQVVNSPFGSAARRADRARKIRAGTSTAKKQKESKDEQNVTKLLQKVAEEAAKNAAAPSTPSTP